MPGKPHSRATKLGASFLARLTSAEVAAATFRVHVRTVKRWQAGQELPDDQWEAIEQTLLARGSEMAAKGDTRGLVQTLTGAGIASRNAHYRQLFARREARKVAEQDGDAPTVEKRREIILNEALAYRPDDDAADRRDRYLSECRRLYIASIDRRLADDPVPLDEYPEPGPQHEAGIYYLLRFAFDTNPEHAAKGAELRAGIDPRSMSDEQYAAMVADLLAEVQAAADEWWVGYCAESQAKARLRRGKRGELLIWWDNSRAGWSASYPPGFDPPPELRGMPIEEDAADLARVDPPVVTPLEPEPPAAPPPKPRPPKRTQFGDVQVLPAGQHLDDHPSWRPAWRSGDPWSRSW